MPLDVRNLQGKALGAAVPHESVTRSGLTTTMAELRRTRPASFVRFPDKTMPPKGPVRLAAAKQVQPTWVRVGGF